MTMFIPVRPAAAVRGWKRVGRTAAASVVVSIVGGFSYPTFLFPSAMAVLFRADRLEAAETADGPSLASIKESLQEAEGLLADGRPAKAAGKLSEAIRGIEALAGGDRIPAGLRGLVDRCRTLKDDLDLEGADVAGLAIPVLKAGGARAPEKKPVPPVAGKPLPRPNRPARPEPLSFASQVAPILTRHCGGCHITGKKGGFQMASYNQLAQSGVVQPGVANGSRLLEVILSGDMPRGGGKVSPEEVGILMQWINAGAGFDGGDPTAAIDGLARAAAAGQQAAMTEAAKPIAAVRLQPGDVSFASAVAPILLQQCAGCHDADDPEGNLSMTSLEALLRGGRGGPPVVKGKGAGSLLVRKLKGVDIEGQRMPLGRPPLSAEQIATIEKWIDQGLKLDALSSRDGLETVAAVGRARALSHAELSALRLAAARKLWKNALPDEEPRLEQREHVVLIGNVSASRLAGLADEAEAVCGRVLEELFGAADQPLVKGGIVVFGFDKAYDYSAFWQAAMRGERPKGLAGHAGVSGDLTYAAIAVPAGDAENADEDAKLVLAEQITAAALLGRRAPPWFAVGAGRTVAVKVAGKAPLAQAWRRTVGDSLQRIGSTADFFGGFADRVAAADVAGGFVGSLATNGSRLRLLVKELDAETPFDQAFAAIFRGPPAPLFEAWAAKEAARKPARRP